MSKKKEKSCKKLSKKQLQECEMLNACFCSYNEEPSFSGYLRFAVALFLSLTAIFITVIMVSYITDVIFMYKILNS